MRSRFPGHIRPTTAAFTTLWAECEFVVDANVLLNLYRYSPDTQKALMDLLLALKDRLWIPHQVGLEYLTNRLSVITAQASAYDNIEKSLREISDEVEGRLGQYRRHPVLKIPDTVDRVRSAIEAERKRVVAHKEGHPNYADPDNDVILSQLVELFDGRVGPAFSEQDRKRHLEQGKIRMEQRVPPGFKDSKKPDDGKYGDYFVWAQVLAYAETSKKSIVLVTDDAKDDWWWVHHGQTMGPRPELVEEMAARANVKFWLYKVDAFMENAKRLLHHKVGKAIIDEVRARRVIDEQAVNLGGPNSRRALRYFREALTGPGDEGLDPKLKLVELHRALIVMHQVQGAELQELRLDADMKRAELASIEANLGPADPSAGLVRSRIAALESRIRDCEYEHDDAGFKIGQARRLMRKPALLDAVLKGDGLE